MKENKKRSKYWTCILYPESDTYDWENIISNIEKISDDYVYILHDQDIDDETGSLKKEHIHVVMSFTNYKWNTALSQEIELPINYLQPVNSLDNILLYLLHFGKKEKHQYSIDLLCGGASLIMKLKRKINTFNKDESQCVSDIINYIIENKNISFTNLVKWVASNGYWADFRRASSIFIKLLEENNNIYYHTIDKYSRK